MKLGKGMNELSKMSEITSLSVLRKGKDSPEGRKSFYLSCLRMSAR